MGLAIAIYGGWAALTFWHAAVPLLLLVPLAAWIIAWHSSLQHEIVHGHPTRWRDLNRVLGFVPLSLWIPFARYRMLHLCHHRDERLTDPLDDPESYYWTDEQWAALDPVSRFLVRAQTRLLGRLVIGPFWSITRFLRSEILAIRTGDKVVARIWARHLLGCAAILAWLFIVCGMTPWTYLLLFVYPGTALLLVRSFAEHKAESAVSKRTAIVEGSPVLGLLFLNNNLHAAHHAHPTLPWYRLPEWYRANRAALLDGNGGLLYTGYGDVFRRFLFAPHDRPSHPLGRAPDSTR
jgi:fatty acid desaturase